MKYLKAGQLTLPELHALLLGSDEYLVTAKEFKLWRSARKKLVEEITLRTR